MPPRGMLLPMDRGQQGLGDRFTNTPGSPNRLLLPLLPQGQAYVRGSPDTPVATPAVSACGSTSPFRRFDFSNRYSPCTANPFYGRYDLFGSKIFGYIEELASDDRMDPRLKLSEIVLPLGDEAEVVLQASYQAFASTITIHAAHLAASLGSIKVMKWLRNKCGPEVLDRQAVESRGIGSIPTYTPLMSALFMSKTEALIWLLNHGASPTVTNADGMTPFHLLASIGLPNESAEVRLSSLARVAAKLVENGADLNVRSGHLDHRTDAEAERARDKTPLELAAGRNSAYPKQALHLLTTSFHHPEQGSLFREVDFVARSNPTAAETLLQKMQERSVGAVKKQLQKEVAEQVKNNQHMDMFLRILKMSPVAGTRLLELLINEPHVVNPQRYPLPLYTVLPNTQMITTYQPGNDLGRPVWESKEPTPRWHSYFRQDLPADPLLVSNVYEVYVRALHMPGILNVGVLSTLSLVKHTAHDLRIFRKVSVAAICNSVWDSCVLSYYFAMAWEFLLLVALVSMGLCPPESEALQKAIRSIIIANLLRDILRGVWGTLNCTTKMTMPVSTYLCHVERGPIVRILSLMLVVLFVNVQVQTGIEKVFTAYNVVVRCAGLTMTMRSINGVLGPLVIAVINSFAPMQGMFVFMIMVFTTFALPLLIFRDADRSFGFVLLYLYQALFLADDQAAEIISGVDVAHQQTLDFGKQMFKGGESTPILAASVVAMLLAASVFSLVLLNLMIGMYTNYYEQMEPLAKLMFEQQRVKEVVGFMMTPAWSLALAIRTESERATTPPHCLALSCFVLLMVYLASLLMQAPSLVAGVLLLAVFELCQAVLLYDFCNVESREDFLWISYRVDFEDQYGEPEQEEIRQLTRETAKARAVHQSELLEVKKELNKLAKELAAILSKFAMNAR